MEFKAWHHPEKKYFRRIYINDLSVNGHTVYFQPDQNKKISICYSSSEDESSESASHIWSSLYSKYGLTENSFFNEFWDVLHQRQKSLDPKKLPVQLSMLEQIPAIGHERAIALLTSFCSIHEISKASVIDLIKVPGISENLAEEIVSFLN